MSARAGGSSSESLKSKIFETVAAVVTAAAVIYVVWATGSAGPLGGGHPVLRFLSVLGIVLISLGAYRWTWEWKVRQEARVFVSESEADLRRAKDQFIGNVSHGLRTSLTGIVGFSHVLKEDLRDPACQEAVDMILAESAELSRIVDDLLITARLDAGVLDIKLEDVAIGEQIPSVLDFMSLLGADVSVDCQDAHVVVDPSRFRHALRNLLVNAHRHGRPDVTVTGAVRNGRYICAVTDQGAGVPAALESRLFTRFAYRSTGEISGHVGLGLAVVKELCDQMGVHVSYRRYRGKTHFVMSIPLVEAARAPIEIQAQSRFRIPKRLMNIKESKVKVPA